MPVGYRRCRLVWLRATAVVTSLFGLFVPLVIALAGPDAATSIVLFVVFPGFFILSFIWFVASVGILCWPCPRCGKPFHSAWNPATANIFARRCFHCGFR